jgi:hypothetical protein
MPFIKQIKFFHKKCVVCKHKYETLFSQSKFCWLECKKQNDKIYQRKYERRKRELEKLIPIDHERVNFLKTVENKLNDMIKKKWYTYCELCKRSDLELKPHHIIHIAEAPKHRNINHEKNIIMLCTLCYRAMFIDKHKKRKTLVKTRKLKDLFEDYIF